MNTWLFRLTICLTLCLTACFPGTDHGHRFMNTSYRAKTFFNGHHLLMAEAIERNDMARLKQLAQGQELSRKGEKEMTLMWFAIMRENFEAIRTLIELGVNPDEERTESLGSALQFTFMAHKDTRYLKAMLDGGLSPNHQSPGNSPLLHRGVFGGLEHVKLLLQRGTRINDRTTNVQKTALDEAINRVKPDIAIYLVQQGADFNTYTVNGASPSWAVHLAINDTRPGNPIHEKFLELRNLLIAKGAKWPPDSPVEVREQMRARGETPVVPYGHTR